jgi:hypothetical protein
MKCVFTRWHARACVRAPAVFMHCYFILQNNINIKYINNSRANKYASDLRVCFTNRGRKMTR